MWSVALFSEKNLSAFIVKQPKSSVARMGPGDIGPKTQTDGKSSGKYI